MLRRRSFAFVAILLGAAPASGQDSPAELADLLAVIRLSKVECRLRADPGRINQLIRSRGYALRDFEPGGRHFGQVQAALARRGAGSAGDRCAQLAQDIRSNPLNRPPDGRAAAARPEAPRERDRGGRVDLNRASLEELNSLPGAGLIGRAIMSGRPYRDPEDLVDRRILNARTFSRIRGYVTVR